MRLAAKRFSAFLSIITVGVALSLTTPLAFAGDDGNSKNVTEDAIFEVNGRTVDLRSLEVRTASGVFQLTLMEVDLLRYLIRNNGSAVSRKQILEDVWGLSEDTDTRAIDNFIVRLRKYIEDQPSRPRYVQTVRGVGYRFVASPRD